MANMNASQIAGLFLKQALEQVKKGDNLIAKQDLQRGWISMFLSEKQYNWLVAQLERDERRNRKDTSACFMIMMDDNNVGIWEIRHVEGRNKIYFSLNDAMMARIRRVAA